MVEVYRKRGIFEATFLQVKEEVQGAGRRRDKALECNSELSNWVGKKTRPMQISPVKSRSSVHKAGLSGMARVHYQFFDCAR